LLLALCGSEIGGDPSVASGRGLVCSLCDTQRRRWLPANCSYGLPPPVEAKGPQTGFDPGRYARPASGVCSARCRRGSYGRPFKVPSEVRRWPAATEVVADGGGFRLRCACVTCTGDAASGTQRCQTGLPC
jgi:hypothetical protein